MSNGHNLSLQGVERAQRRARGLGWFSLGLGLAQILAARPLSRLVGLPATRGTRRTMQLIGLREIASGIGLLGRERPTGFLWSRVVGDVIDLALLARALAAPPAGGMLLRRNRTNRARLPLAIASVAGVTALDLLTSRALTRADRRGIPVARPREVHLSQSITVGRPPEEIYRFWRNPQNLASFMSLVESVEVIDDRRSRWTMAPRLLGGKRAEPLQWESEITEDVPHERIAWRALAGAPLRNEGVVRFRRAPGGRGTEVHLDMRIEPPGGALATAAARVLRKIPEIKLHNDLRRFKQVVELGEVIQSDASIHRAPHPARPSAGAPDTSELSDEEI